MGSSVQLLRTPRTGRRRPSIGAQPSTSGRFPGGSTRCRSHLPPRSQRRHSQQPRLGGPLSAHRRGVGEGDVAHSHTGTHSATRGRKPCHWHQHPRTSRALAERKTNFKKNFKGFQTTELPPSIPMLCSLNMPHLESRSAPRTPTQPRGTDEPVLGGPRWTCPTCLCILHGKFPLSTISRNSFW